MLEKEKNKHLTDAAEDIHMVRKQQRESQNQHMGPVSIEQKIIIQGLVVFRWQAADKPYI